MYSPDVLPPWHESLRETQVELTLAAGGRDLRPLPKRQRLYSAATTTATPATGKGLGEGAAGQDREEVHGYAGPIKREKKVDDTSDDSQPRYRPAVSTEATREYRPATEGLTDGTASDHPPRLHVPPLAHHDYDLGDKDGSTKTSLDPSNESDSPPTSPSSVLSLDLKLPRGPDYFPLFGEAGEDVVRSYSSSSAGLFDGLSQGTLPSRPIAADRPAVGEDDEDDEGYSALDRVSEGRVYVEADGSGFGGNNKKKRKIPGVNSTMHDEDERGFDDEPAGGPMDGPYARVDFPVDGILSKVRAADTPKTAKAALAKLRVRPLHISASHLTSSHRRFLQRRRARTKHHSPLTLPPAVVYYTPASYSTGPPPLPPGSGLKGSKALKAAKKLEKEREKEKERVKALLGGGKIELRHFWEPESKATAAPSRVGLLSTSGKVAKGSTSNATHESPLTKELFEKDSFDFDMVAPTVVTIRWKALNDHIERSKLAREREKKTLEEEEAKEKELEAKAAKEKEEWMAKDAAETAALRKVGEKPQTARRSAGPLLPKSSAVAVTTSPRPADSTTPATKASVNPTPLASPPLTSPSKTKAAVSPISSPPPPPPTRLPPPPRIVGKKKRAAHANSLNSHHRSNYIPSRMPSSNTPPQHAQTDDPLGPALTHWPASDEAIEAAGGAEGLLGGDDWLCTFCEYELFFGDVKKVVEKRKKVLKIRKKAQERASKAARGEGKDSTVSAPAPSAKSPTPTTESPVPATT